MNKNLQTNNPFELYTTSINKAINLIDNNKIDDCKKLLQKMKIFSLSLAQVESLSMCLESEDDD